MRRVQVSMVLYQHPRLPAPGRIGVSAAMQEDGSALVRQGSVIDHWSPAQLVDAAVAAQQCCAVRRVNFVLAALDNCPCLACEVSKVYVRWRDARKV